MTEGEKKYTLDEAVAMLADQQCKVEGHDWEFVESDGREDPIAILCSRCNRSLAIPPRQAKDESKLPIIGRERYLIDKLTKQIRDRSISGHAVSNGLPTDRGNRFEVLIHVDKKPTGHVVAVTVELARFDEEIARQYVDEQKAAKRR